MKDFKYILAVVVWLTSMSGAKKIMVPLTTTKQTSVEFPKPNKGLGTHAILSLPRGGAILAPETAAKVYTAVFGLNAIQGLLFTKAHAAFYQTKEYNTYLNFLLREALGAGCNISLLLYLQYFQAMAFEKAVGWSCIPYMLQVVYKLATGILSELKIPVMNAVLVLALNGAVTYATLTNATFSKRLVQFYAVFSLINALLMYFVPEVAAKTWNLPVPNATQKHLIAVVGFYLTSHALVVGLQAFDKSANVATGWSIVAVAAGLFGLVAKGTFRKADMPNGLGVGWAIFVLALAHALLVG